MNQIPIAIVKPKYQKSSFDERQLPVIAYFDQDKAWYDKQNKNNNESTSLTNTKKIHLPEFDRKVKKHLKSCNSISTHNIETTNAKRIMNRSGSTDSSEDVFAVNDSDTVASTQKTSKKKTSTVAIVQPRKKEKMNERELMEIILQMQIKKNSQMNRNRSNIHNSKENPVAMNESIKIVDNNLSKSQADESGKFYHKCTLEIALTLMCCFLFCIRKL